MIFDKLRNTVTFAKILKGIEPCFRIPVNIKKPNRICFGHLS